MTEAEQIAKLTAERDELAQALKEALQLGLNLKQERDSWKTNSNELEYRCHALLAQRDELLEKMSSLISGIRTAKVFAFCFAQANPRWTRQEILQDPGSVHQWLEKYKDL